MKKRRFPTLAILVLIAALIWLFSDLGYIQVNVPWIPLILIVLATGWIINRYTE